MPTPRAGSSNSAIGPTRSSGPWRSPGPACRGSRRPGFTCSWTAGRASTSLRPWPAPWSKRASTSFNSATKGGPALDDRQLLERAAALREITRAAGVLFIMNDRPDLAVLAQADGVHVGQEDVSVKAARTIVGPDGLVGVSTHSIDQARQAVLDGANYIGVGPTFPSGTKQFDQFPGLDLLRAVADEIRLPAFAIGGIGPENLSEVLQTGIGRIAVSGAVLNAA